MIKFNNVGFLWFLSALLVLMVLLKMQIIYFSDFSLAKNIWHYFSFVFGHTLLDSNCWKSMAIHWWSSFKSFDQFTLLVYLLPSLLYWEVWLACNKERFEESHSNAISIIGKIKKWMLDLNPFWTLKLLCLMPTLLNSFHISRLIVQTKKPILVKQTLPPMGTLKFNIDNASKDHPGRWL